MTTLSRPYTPILSESTVAREILRLKNEEKKALDRPVVDKMQRSPVVKK